MTTETINSGAINAIGFPGAEDGLSLIEMVGSVRAVASISSITLRLTAGAVVAALAAPGQASPKLVVSLSAGTQGAATCSASSTIKVKVFPAQQSAVAGVSDIDAGIRMSVSAVASPAASAVPVSGKTIVSRAGSASASAVGSAGSYKRATRSASASAAALTSQAQAILRVRRSASTTAFVGHAIRVVGRYRVAASTSTSASVAANALVSNFVSGSVSAVASAGQPVALVYKPVSPTPTFAVASATSAGLYIVSSIEADANAVALAQATPALRFFLGASTSTAVSSSTAAADYSVTIPAPDERLMVLPAMNRRMEVTE